MTAADAADEIALRHFGGDIAVERKEDESPVTVADRSAEQAIRKILSGHYPDHALYGEEYGRAGQSRYLWLIDPIDGTRSFIRSLPFWSTQIALMVDGELVLGVSSAPRFQERAWAVRGSGAFINGRQVQARDAQRLEDIDLCVGNLRSLSNDPEGWAWFGSLISRAARSRGYGDFYSYHRLADGGQDAVVESDVNILDIAALVVLVREAGAVITDLDGQPIDLDTTSVMAAGPELHRLLWSSRP